MAVGGKALKIGWPASKRYKILNIPNEQFVSPAQQIDTSTNQQKTTALKNQRSAFYKPFEQEHFLLFQFFQFLL